VKLTLADAKARVEEIRAIAHDDERAHGLEDDLRRDVLETITAPGCSLTARQMRNLAVVALSTRHIKFGRYCS
jgi:hypothetical protein